MACGTRFSLAVGLMLAATFLGSTRVEAQAAGGAPSCPGVRVPYVLITEDGGATFLPYHGSPRLSPFIAWGLAATDVPGRVYLHTADAFWVSEDDGCTWAKFAENAFGIMTIAAAPGGQAYAWPYNGLGSVIYQLAPGGKTRVGYGAIPRPVPDSGLQGFGVDTANASHVRTVGFNGQIFESTNAGQTWSAIGVLPNSSTSIQSYFASFDAQDLDHVVYGRAHEGGFVTFDGGQTWSASTGLSTGRVNFFNGVISPVDGNIVYGQALDREEFDAGLPSQGRHIYRSTDGGLTFTPVLDHLSNGVFLTNGPLMRMDDNVADQLLFVDTTRPLFGGTTFYYYNGSTATLQVINNPDVGLIRSITAPFDAPGRLIMGIEIPAG